MSPSPSHYLKLEITTWIEYGSCPWRAEVCDQQCWKCSVSEACRSCLGSSLFWESRGGSARFYPGRPRRPPWCGDGGGVREWKEWVGGWESCVCCFVLTDEWGRGMRASWRGQGPQKCTEGWGTGVCSRDPHKEGPWECRMSLFWREGEAWLEGRKAGGGQFWSFGLWLGFICLAGFEGIHYSLLLRSKFIISTSCLQHLGWTLVSALL